MPTGIYQRKSMTEEQKLKIAIALRGRKHSVERRINQSMAHWGKIPWNKGKKLPPQSQETIRKRALSLRGKRGGEKSHFWKGGITAINKVIRSSFEYQEWRKFVFIRDGRKCVICGSREKINADHIIPLSMTIRTFKIKNIEQARDCSELWNTDNGRTLCENCHRKTITYGPNRHRMDQLADKLKEILCQIYQRKYA